MTKSPERSGVSRLGHLARVASIAVSTLALLAGCVAIPSSGSVNEGPPVQNGAGGGSPVDLPGGPPRNASGSPTIMVLTPG